ncbi:uncharacterized protein LOC110990728 isoform X2 [Acanthaster planci]|uniref:Uncharacterized protein LOC110990728 isoform X2 n=1 Tax=Acanthaster planci TaxID=133434 RepID=A0A8B8A196_ACAPL|nr:uncharacterized protein LOC110990728 isoform X2 [Acanthaster planci]
MAYMRMRKVVQDAIIIVMLVHICIPLSACSPHHACPPASANITQDVFRLANKSANAQLGLWHRLPCQSYRPEEHPFGIVWYRGRSIDDPARQTLITYQDNDTYRESDRYVFSSNFGLIIKGIDRRDEGSFLCEVVFKNADSRVEEINLQVIDDYFPPRIGDGSLPANLQRGHRHKVSCRAPQTPEAPVDVVYWSVGEGITTDTEIIAARFIKHGGTNLFFNYGADFSVNSDASLTVNSLESFQENRVTLWCHVFQSNGTLSSSSTEVYISEDKNSSTAFRNSTTSTFYLKRGSTQVLPCTSWTPGDAMCNVQWFHESSEQPVVSYNVSANILEVDSVYDFAGSFGLVISSANSSHAGQYNCTLASTDSGTKIGVINVFVECPNPGIPEGGTRRGPSSFMPGAEVSFDCHDGYEREGSIFSVCQENGEWSFPAPKCIQMNEGDDGSSLTWLGILGGCLVFIILFLGALWYMYSRRKGCFKRSQQDFNDGRTTEIGTFICVFQILIHVCELSTTCSSHAINLGSSSMTFVTHSVKMSWMSQSWNGSFGRFEWIE